MLRTSIFVAATLLYFGGPTSICPQQPPKARISKPLAVFYPDDENAGLKDAAPPTDIVLNALLKTAEARLTGTRLTELDRESQRKVFRVAQVDLGDAEEKDFIAVGSKPMTGADNEWFWIVRVRQGRASVLLFTGALSVSILPHKTNGRHDISSFWTMGANELFRRYGYNGTVYKLTGQRYHEIKP
jgi:hypothetical protein